MAAAAVPIVVPDDLLRRHAVTRTGTVGAPPVLLLHGFGCDQTIWDQVRIGLDPFHEVLSYDHLGSGRSDLAAYDDRRYSTVHGYVDDLLQLVRRLDLRDVALVGHSVGAAVGLLATVAEPERFSRLVLVGASPWYQDEDGYRGGYSADDLRGLLDLIDADYLAWSADMTPVIMGNPDRPELGAALHEQFARLAPRIGRQFARVSFLGDYRAEAEQVSVPTLVVQTRDDVVVPEEVGHWLHGTILGSELALLGATGHCPQVSAPEETTRVLRRFLAAGSGHPR
ncbi:alpha/beta fold hydrolase [Cellulomonas soli]|uniref:alpha/beta fold hydrolase n=1 Tax=Cellulomonas soli TaxID=931535 RepID=UPI003F8406B5